MVLSTYIDMNSAITTIESRNYFMVICRINMTIYTFLWVSLYSLPDHHAELNDKYTILQYHISGGFFNMMHKDTG